MTEDLNYNYFESEEFKNSLSLFEQCREEGKSCILGSDELADIAEFYYENGKYTLAREAAEYATTIYPDACAPRVFLARFSLALKKDCNEAWENISRISDTTLPEYFTILGEYQLARGNNKAATETFADGETTIHEDERQDYRLDVAFLLLDYSLTKEATEWAQRITDKNSPEYKKLCARLHFEKGEHEKAIEILEKALDKNPFYTDYWNLLATIQLSADKYSDAAASSEYAIAINDGCAESYLNLGNAYFKLCNYDKAIEAYTRFAALNENELGEILLARCYFCKQMAKEAIKHLAEAQKRCSDNRQNFVDIHKDLAIIYGWTGEGSKAFRHIDILKNMNYDDPELNLIEGGVLLGMNKFSKANEVFMRGYEKSELPNEYLFQVAVNFYEHNFDDVAYQMLKEIFRLEPQRTRGLSYIAVCCNYLGLKDEFLFYLKEAVEKNVDEAKAVLSEIFPASVTPQDYYEFALKHFDKNNKRSDTKEERDKD